jgi:hypothetical protein
MDLNWKKDSMVLALSPLLPAGVKNNHKVLGWISNGSYICACSVTLSVGVKSSHSYRNHIPHMDL